MDKNKPHPNPIHYADMLKVVDAFPKDKVSQLMESMAGKNPFNMTQDEFMLYIRTYDAEDIIESNEEFEKLLVHHGIYR